MATIPDLDAFFAKLSLAELQKLKGTPPPPRGTEASQEAGAPRRPEGEPSPWRQSTPVLPASEDVS